MSRHDSPVPEPTVLKDTASETVTALAAPPSVNTTSGIGRPGEEQLARYDAHPAIAGIGGAEGVVGAAQGAAPEYIAKVRKVGTSEADTGVEANDTVCGPDDTGSLNEGAGEAGLPVASAGGEEEETGGKAKPKWFKKVASAANSIKEKARDVAESVSSQQGIGGRDRADSAASAGSLAAPDGTASPFGRSRSRSIGARSAHNVSFAPETSELRPLPKIVTDRDGHPVPVEVGATGGATPTSSTRDGLAPPHGGVMGGNVSTSTSVKDKILESGYDVEPKTTHEKFHHIFPEIPEDEELIEDYRCALVRDILVQGKLYVSETYLSFRANILGWETSLSIPWTEIVSIEKRMTAKILPNAIEVRTLHATHTFSSFLSRDASYSLIVACWRHVHPEASRLQSESRAAAKEERRRLRSTSVSTATTEPDTDTDDDVESKSEISFEDEHGEKKRHRFRIRSRASAALRSLRSTAAAGDGAGAEGPTEADKVKNAARAQAAAEGGEGVHAPTTYDGPEYKNEALDCVLPTTPFKAFVLFFKNEGFLRHFLEETEHLKEIDIGPWRALSGSAAEDDDSHALKQREMNYLKPLNAPVGPKQTHCNIHDENEKLDEESYISNLTRTRTPDVPSGDGFSVVTRTTFTWAEGGGCHVRVTTEVEWTKVNRLLKGVIERGAIDGQKQYHRDLESAVRAHIDANPNEYRLAGVSDRPTAATTTTVAEGKPPSAGAPAERTGLFAALPLSTDHLALALLALVAVLAVTNLLTLRSLRSASSAAAQSRLGHPGEVASAVSRVLGEFNALHARRFDGEGVTGGAGELGEVKLAVEGLVGSVRGVMRQLEGAVRTLNEVADRVEGVRGAL
ncbi:hypothetical protein JCM10207_003521 [Rhodosporidiobolus poonsookiae]